MAALHLDPGIQQNVAWPTIEAANRLAGAEQAEITEATDVENCPHPVGRLERRFVKGLH
ncbi:hypothetical protein D3C77_591670 [compost metagenome]